MEGVMKFPEDAKKFFDMVFPGGSKYICDPPVLDTDEDWICLLKQPSSPYEVLDNVTPLEGLQALGFELQSNNPMYSELQKTRTWPFKRGIHNLIVCETPEYYSRWVAGSKVCKLLNIQDRDTRVAIHKYYRYMDDADFKRYVEWCKAKGVINLWEM